MKKTYYADFNFKGDFEIIFNGLSLKRNKSMGVSNGLEYLNPFIEKSGKQSISLILKSLSGKISPDEVKNYYIDIVYTDNGEPAPVHKVMRCSFPAINRPTDSLVYTWTFEADVPYSINGFENSKDLTKEDQKILLRDVIDFYKKVSTIINDGDSKEYLNIYQESREREMISMYYHEEKQKEYLSSIADRVQSSKGFIQPLENYRMFIHPNKKLVELIINDEDSALFSKGNKGKKKFYGLQLHRSLKTGKLEVY